MSTIEESVRVAAELRTCLADIERLSVAIYGQPAVYDRDGNVVRAAIAGWEERYKRRRLEAHQASTVKHGKKRTVDEHNTFADLESMSEWAEFNALSAGLRVAKEQAHTLRQILSTLQTATRVEADLSR